MSNSMSYHYPSKKHLLDLQEATKAFIGISHWRNPTAVTLTVRKVQVFGSTRVWADLHECSKNLRHFLNLLNKRAYRSQGKKIRIGCIPVIEQMQDGRYHYHLALDRPEHISAFRFRFLVAQLWAKTHWGYKQVRVEPKCDDGWINYIAKLKSKASYPDAFDWLNFTPEPSIHLEPYRCSSDIRERFDSAVLIGDRERMNQ